MKVMVLGGGGREHAVVHALSKSKITTELHCCPGNPGIAKLALCHAGDPCDPKAMKELCTWLGIELVFVGPEAPLVAGTADALREAGILVVGPGASGARLEGSKAFSKTFMKKLRKYHTYRNSEPTTSILTITSNVVYGKATGSLPDRRKAGEPLSPGANPSYGAEQNGLLASLNSVAKLPYEFALDGISNTQTISPDALGHSEDERVKNLVAVMDGYFERGAHHLNVNIFGTEKLVDAMEHPEKPEYANFTIRVSGYAVKFIDLTREQQLDVIARTCHKRM